MRFILSKNLRLQARVSAFWFQYQLSVRYMPWVAFRPSEWMSLMNTSRPASFIVLVMPNSLAALIELIVSPPALARPEDLRLAALRLQQEGRKIAGVQRRVHRAHHLAAGGLDHLGGIGLQLLAERVVGRQEEPGLAALLDHRVAGALGQRHRVVGPMHRVGRALVVGERRGRGADDDERLLLLGGHLGHRQGRAGVGAADQHVQVPCVSNHSRALVAGHVRLVLVVRRQDFDLLAVDRAAHVRDGHPDGFHAALAVEVGIHAGHVRDDADADHVA